MKTFFTLIILLFTSSLFSQEKVVATEIISRHNVFEPSILQTFPDSFPQISVVFQAENKFGEPLWLLKKEEIGILENEEDCEIVRLMNISRDKPLNVGIVLDESGSMMENPKQDMAFKPNEEVYFYGGYTLPKSYTPAIIYAKRGIYGFLEGIDHPGDSVLYISFSSQINRSVNLTNDFEEVKYYVQRALPNGRTAFYDALMATLKKLNKKTANVAVVALTDGQDNSSRYTQADVIRLAKEKEIPIYIIGLGNVHSSSLKKISQASNGFYYYTDDPKTLKNIYLKIKKQIKSIYQLDYVSNSKDFENEEREIAFYFKNDTLAFADHSSRFELPEEAMTYLKEQERIRLGKVKAAALADAQRVKQERLKKYLLLGGGLGTVLLLGIGSFVVYKKKQPKQSLSIKKVYPNPFNDFLTLDYNIEKTVTAATINILDINGKLVFSKPLNPNLSLMNLNLSMLGSGMYSLQIIYEGGRSNTQKIIKH